MRESLQPLVMYVQKGASGIPLHCMVGAGVVGGGVVGGTRVGAPVVGDADVGCIVGAPLGDTVGSRVGESVGAAHVPHVAGHRPRTPGLVAHSPARDVHVKWSGWPLHTKALLCVGATDGSVVGVNVG